MVVHIFPGFSNPTPCFPPQSLELVPKANDSSQNFPPISRPCHGSGMTCTHFLLTCLWLPRRQCQCAIGLPRMRRRLINGLGGPLVQLTCAERYLDMEYCTLGYEEERGGGSNEIRTTRRPCRCRCECYHAIWVCIHLFARAAEAFLYDNVLLRPPRSSHQPRVLHPYSLSI